MKVLVSDPIAEQGIQVLKDAGIEVVQKTGLSPEELAQIIGEFDGIIVRSATKVTQAVIEAAKNLKVIGRAGIGLDNIDLDTAKKKNIKVVNTPTATSISVAELALGMMFAAARRIPQASVSTKSGKWEKKKFKGLELYGKTLGIIGVGRIGTELAKRAQALGMNVLAYDPNVSTHDIADMVDLDALLGKADYISLHIPKTEQTTHILDKAAFDKMKDGVAIINCARGGVVDEQALHDAMSAGKVRITGIDVYESEPAKENRLFELEQTIATPHIGAQTKEGQTRAGVQIAELVRDAIK